MSEEALVLRMVVDCMAGKKEAMWALYEEYVKTRYLHVPIGEILAWKGRVRCGGNSTVLGVSSMVESGA